MPKPPRYRKKLSTRQSGDNVLDLLAFPGFPPTDNFLGAVLGVILGVVIVVLLVSIVWPIVALTLEAIVVIVLFTAGLIGRLVFGRPWRIEARTIGTPRLEREIYAKGLRGSREAIDELASQIASGA